MNYIENVKSLDNYQLKVFFTDNKVKIFDFKKYLELEAFRELKQQDYFKLVKNGKYFIFWPNEQDLSSDTLYLEGIEAASA